MLVTTRIEIERTPRMTRGPYHEVEPELRSVEVSADVSLNEAGTDYVLGPLECSVILEDDEVALAEEQLMETFDAVMHAEQTAAIEDAERDESPPWTDADMGPRQ